MKANFVSVHRSILTAVVAGWMGFGWGQVLRGQEPILTLTNPAPSRSETFGNTVARVADNILIANPRDLDDAGSVSLYSSNGVQIRTFHNPSRANGEFFGVSVAALGSDKVIIGAPLSSPPPVGRTGAAYLFQTNGTLLRTFLRPTSQPFAAFGFGVAAVGQDRVLIGAPGDNRAGPGAGAAYLFGTNGTLLATITNHHPESGGFGAALAVLGSDRFLIGAPGQSAESAGAACLVTTNGTLLRWFNDPNGLVGSAFGGALAVLGDDRLVIAASQANVEAPAAGAVNIFDTNGLIIAPLFNPEPDFLDQFGMSVAVVDGDKVLVGAEDQRTAMAGGGAYLFATNGTLLMTINQPVKEFSRLGTSVADLGEGRILLGAPGSDLAGAAYVYHLAPRLQISPASNEALSVSWPSAWTGWTLQQNTNLNSAHWMPVPGDLVDNGTEKSLEVGPVGGDAFFRLVKP